MPTDENKRLTRLADPTIFQIPRSFDFTLKNCHRAIIVSVMLPFSPQIIQDYVFQIIKTEKGSSRLFARIHEDVNGMLDKAIQQGSH